MKYVQTHFRKEHLCALQVSFCARTRAQLRGNIAHGLWFQNDQKFTIPPFKHIYPLRPMMRGF